MCSVPKRLLFRVLTFLLTFYLGAAIGMYLRPRTDHVLTVLVRQPAVYVGPEIVSVPDADMPDSLQEFHLQSASIKLHAVVDRDGRVTAITPEHTLYTMPSEEQVRPMPWDVSERLKLELQSIVSKQVRGTQFSPPSLADDQDSMDVTVTGSFVTPGDDYPPSKACSQITLTFQSDDGRVMWQGNTERQRSERCFSFDSH
jgi:hypothetical protein